MPEFVEGLERVLHKHAEAVIFQGRDAYVQAVLVSAQQLKLEAVSEAFLEKPLTTAQLVSLRRLGFQPPGPLSPNHWQYAPADAASAAAVLAAALSEVYGESIEAVQVVDFEGTEKGAIDGSPFR